MFSKDLRLILLVVVIVLVVFRRRLATKKHATLDEKICKRTHEEPLDIALLPCLALCLCFWQGFAFGFGLEAEERTKNRNGCNTLEGK